MGCAAIQLLHMMACTRTLSSSRRIGWLEALEAYLNRDSISDDASSGVLRYANLRIQICVIHAMPPNHTVNLKVRMFLSTPRAITSSSAHSLLSTVTPVFLLQSTPTSQPSRPSTHLPQRQQPYDFQYTRFADTDIASSYRVSFLDWLPPGEIGRPRVG